MSPSCSLRSRFREPAASECPGDGSPAAARALSRTGLADAAARAPARRCGAPRVPRRRQRPRRVPRPYGCEPRRRHRDRRPARRDRADREGLGRRGVAPGQALRDGRRRVRGRAVRDHDVPRRRVPRRQPQARRHLLRRHRDRPVPSRLHDQRDGARARRARRWSTRWAASPTSPPGGSAPRSRPRCRSATTRCACCGPPGSLQRWASSPTPICVRGGRAHAGPARRSSAPSASATSCRSCCWPTTRRPDSGSSRGRASPTSSCPSSTRWSSSRTRSTGTRTCWRTRSPSSRRPSPRLKLRLGALLHDVGKPTTRGYGPQGVTFHYHDVVGARMARKRLLALRYPNDVVDDVTRARRAAPALPHLPDGLDRQRGAPLRARRRSAARRPQRAHALRLHDAQRAEGRRRWRAAWTSSRRASRELREQEELAKLRPALDGNAVMRILAVEPGPDRRRGAGVPHGDPARRGRDPRSGGRAPAPRLVRGPARVGLMDRDHSNADRVRRLPCGPATAPRWARPVRDRRPEPSAARAARRPGSPRGAAPRTRRRSCAATAGPSRRRGSRATGRTSKYERRTSSAPSGRAPGDVVVASEREAHRVVVREHERRAGAQHAVHLTEQAVEVLDLVDHAGGEREIDRVGAEEREVGRVALVPLDAHLGVVGVLARERELRRGSVDRDHVRALSGHRHGVLAGPAARRRGPAGP